MWTMIPSLADIVADIAPAFTHPSFATYCRFLIGWVMCLGKHTLLRVAENTQPQEIPDHRSRHAFDGYYNFFERSAWTPQGPGLPRRSPHPHTLESLRQDHPARR